MPNLNDLKETLKLAEAKVGTFSTYQTTTGHGQNIPFTSKPAQQLLHGLGVPNDSNTRLSEKTDGEPLPQQNNQNVTVDSFDPNSQDKLEITGARIDRLVKSAKTYVNTDIIPEGHFQEIISPGTLTPQTKDKSPKTGVHLQNLAVGVCHAQEIDLLATPITGPDGKAILGPRTGTIDVDAPAMLLLSTPALNFEYGWAKELKDHKDQQAQYIESMYRTIFHAAVSEGREYITLPAAGLGVFGGDPATYFTSLMKVAKEFPQLNIIYNAGNPINAPLFDQILEQHKPQNLVRTDRDVLILAHELTQQGKPCAFHNPSDADVVLGINDVGEYWKKGKGNNYVGEEHIGAMTTAALNSKLLNPNAYQNVVEHSFQPKPFYALKEKDSPQVSPDPQVSPTVVASPSRIERGIDRPDIVKARFQNATANPQNLHGSFRTPNGQKLLAIGKHIIDNPPPKDSVKDPLFLNQKLRDELKAKPFVRNQTQEGLAKKDRKRLTVHPVRIGDYIKNNKSTGKTLVVSLANATNVGGYPWTHMAQEEALVHQTDLLWRAPAKYPPEGLKAYGDSYRIEGVKQYGYGPNGEITQENNEFDIAFVAAPDYSNTIDPLTDKEREEYIQHMTFLFRSQCEHALASGAEKIVMGALGCGAFRNNPFLVAAIARSVLSEDKYKDLNVDFAISYDPVGQYHPRGPIPHNLPEIFNAVFDADANTINNILKNAQPNNHALFREVLEDPAVIAKKISSFASPTVQFSQLSGKTMTSTSILLSNKDDKEKVMDDSMKLINDNIKIIEEMKNQMKQGKPIDAKLFEEIQLKTQNELIQLFKTACQVRNIFKSEKYSTHTSSAAKLKEAIVNSERILNVLGLSGREKKQQEQSLNQLMLMAINPAHEQSLKEMLKAAIIPANDDNPVKAPVKPAIDVKPVKAPVEPANNSGISQEKAKELLKLYRSDIIKMQETLEEQTSVSTRADAQYLPNFLKALEAIAENKPFQIVLTAAGRNAIDGLKSDETDPQKVLQLLARHSGFLDTLDFHKTQIDAQNMNNILNLNKEIKLHTPEPVVNKSEEPKIIFYRAENGELAVQFPTEEMARAFQEKIGVQSFPLDDKFGNAGKKVPTTFSGNPSVLYFPAYTARNGEFTAVFPSDEMRNNFYKGLIKNPIPENHMSAGLHEDATRVICDSNAIYFKDKSFFKPGGNVSIPVPEELKSPVIKPQDHVAIPAVGGQQVKAKVDPANNGTISKEQAQALLNLYEPYITKMSEAIKASTQNYNGADILYLENYLKALKAIAGVDKEPFTLVRFEGGMDMHLVTGLNVAEGDPQKVLQLLSSDSEFLEMLCIHKDEADPNIMIQVLDLNLKVKSITDVHQAKDQNPAPVIASDEDSDGDHSSAHL